MSSQASVPKRLLEALQRRPVDRPPFWFMRQAGRYLPEYRAVRERAGSFLGLCDNPALAAEVTLQPVRRFGMDAAILFADILLLPRALGQAVAFREGEGPVLEPIGDAAAFAGWQAEALHGRLAPVYETVGRAREQLPPGTALIGFAGAPWTVATYMAEGGGSPDQARAKRWAYGDPEGFCRLIDILVEATVAYLGEQVRAGAEAVQLFDTWAGALSEPGVRRWCLEPARRIATALKREFPALPVIAFPRGVGVLYEDFAREPAFDGIGIDTAVPCAWAAERLQPHAVVQGNLDPQWAVAGGEGMLREARRILDALAGGPHVFNLGHGFVPDTPPAHVEALSALLREPERAR